MAFLFLGYSGNFSLYHLWEDRALGKRLEKVKTKKPNPANDQVAMAQPNQTKSSPK